MRIARTGAILLAGVAAAALAAASEMDEELMATIETVAESLSSNIALQDVAAARTDASDLESLFAEVQVFFEAHADGKDAVEYTKKTRELSGAVLVAIDAGKFDDAANAASEIGRTCKSCHRKYKP